MNYVSPEVDYALGYICFWVLLIVIIYALIKK